MCCEEQDESWDDFVDHECPCCGGYLGIDCTCTDGDGDYYMGMDTYNYWYESLSPLGRRLEDAKNKFQNLRWHIIWKAKEWWRDNIRREELPF